MKKKIVLLPLDNRPCNSIFPLELFAHNDIDITIPKALGNKKSPANFDDIKEYLIKECEDADGLVMSIDMLLYGGLVPSRIHNEKKEVLKERADLIHKIREKRKDLTIYAFQVVMRCPSYSSSDEEPDYYETWGSDIHKMGEIIHKSRLGIEDKIVSKLRMPNVDNKALNDYIKRRQINCDMNHYVLNFVKDGDVDFMVVPQDDAERYGYAAMDQEQIRMRVEELDIRSKVLIYPGADEVTLTLISRMINFWNKKSPKVYVKYMCEQAKNITPLYEGNMLSSTIKSHLLAAGCKQTESYEYADITLVITAPSSKMQEAINQPSKLPEYNNERNFPEAISFIKNEIAEKRIVSVADNAYANGGELSLIKYMNSENILLSVDGYAGWNTSANTIGTAIAESIDAFYFGKNISHENFLIKRYIEDVGYCSIVRDEVSRLLEEYGMDYFDVKETNGIISNIVEENLKKFIKEVLYSICDKIYVKEVYMPWKRMFEVGFKCGKSDV